MKRVLIDTNVAIDFYLKLPEFFEAADQIFQAIRNRTTNNWKKCTRCAEESSKE